MTPDFKNTKFHFRTLAEAVQIEKAMFSLGFCWISHKTGQQRKPFIEQYGMAAGFIYVDKNCRMTQSGESYGFEDTLRKAAFASALFDAAATHKETKRLNRIARRKKLSARKMLAGGWIKHDGGPMPVDRGTMIVAKFHDPARDDGPRTAGSYWWNHQYPKGDIIGYKLYEEPKLISLGDMIDHIVKDAGGHEVLADGWIRHTGDGQPVSDDTLVEAKFQDGSGHVGKAEGFGWNGNTSHYGPEMYRIVAEKVAFVPVGEVTDLGSFAGTPLDPATNPKHAIGNTSLPMTMPSALFRAMVALGKQNGAGKYGGANYIGTPVVMSTYMNAIQRHFDKILMGEDCDEVDGVPHWGAIGANIDIIVSAQAAGSLIDDRLRADGQLEAYKALTPLVSSLAKLHEGRTPKHFYMKDAT
jgi:hypothetical protein